MLTVILDFISKIVTNTNFLANFCLKLKVSDAVFRVMMIKIIKTVKNLNSDNYF